MAGSIRTLAAAVALACACYAHAQTHSASSGQAYPTKPVRIITTQTGGGSDVIARLIAPALTASFGQQVIVDNRGGVALAIEVAARAAGDGYTMLVNGNNLWLVPLLRDHVTWNAFNDFAPITIAISSPSCVIVHPSLPVASVKDLIELARRRPGELHYAAGTIGATPHLAAEVFKSMAKIDLVRVPYKGTGPSLVGVMSGEAQVIFATLGTAGTHVKSGKLKALAVATLKPSALAPDLPTVAASGLPGYESTSPQAVFVPARTPAALVKRLHQEVTAALTKPDMQQRLTASGIEVVASSPQELVATMKRDVATIGRVIKENGIRAD